MDNNLITNKIKKQTQTQMSGEIIREVSPIRNDAVPIRGSSFRREPSVEVIPATRAPRVVETVPVRGSSFRREPSVEYVQQPRVEVIQPRAEYVQQPRVEYVQQPRVEVIQPRVEYVQEPR